MAECDICHTPLETRGTRMFCPACMLKDLWADDEEPTQELDAEQLTTPVPQDGSLPVIPRHRLIAKLGEGGFAVVYRAMQLEPVRREVAVKVLRENLSSEQVLARFETERQTLARMEHPGIARLWDAGQTDGGQPFFAMELVRGLPITSYVASHRLPLRDRLELFVPVCRAVQHAHEKGVLHRDIKPSNLLVDENKQVKVIDFGIAKALEVSPDDGPSVTTSIHQAIGTPGYMSPEQAEWGSTQVDARSDIYALGVLLFELVTGRTPLEVERRTRPDARRRAVASIVTAPSSAPGNLLTTKTQQRDLDAIILKALERESELRYASAAALADEVVRHLSDQPVDAAQHSVTYVIGKFARRHRGLVAAISVAVLAVIAGLLGTTTLFLREQHVTAQLDKALQEAKNNADEIQRSLSRESFAVAQRFKEMKDYQSAVASLTRSLEADPTFEAAAADLQTVLAYGEFIQPLEPALLLDKKWGKIIRGAVAGDGRTMAMHFRAAKADEKLMLWQRSNDSWQERQLPVDQAPITDLAMAGTGRLLVHVESGKTACVTSLDGANHATRRWSPAKPITGAAVDTRGSAALIGCEDGSVWRLFPETSLQPELLFKLTHAVTHLATNDSQQGVTVGSSNGEVHRWLPGRPGSILVARMPASVSVLTQASMVGPVAIGDIAGNVARVLPGHTEPARHVNLHSGAVTALAFAGFTGVISAGSDLLIRWYDLEKNSDLQPPVQVAGPVQKIDFTRSDEDATFVTKDASVRQWRYGDETPLTLRKPQRSSFVTMSVTGRCLVVQRDEGASLEVLSLAGHAAARMMLHSGGARMRGAAPPRALSFGADAETLVSVDGQSNCAGWNTTDAQLLQENTWPRPALALKLLPEGKIAAALVDGSLVESTPEGRALVDVLKADARDLLSPLATAPMSRWGTACIAAGGDGAAWAETSPSPDAKCQIRLFRRSDGKVSSYEWNRVSCIAYDPARNTLVIGLHNGAVRIVEIEGSGQRNYSWHLSTVTSLALSNDGTVLITGSSDGTIALWDPINGSPRSDYLRLGKPVRAVTFSGDNKRFAVATDESFMVGDVATRALIGPRLSLAGYGGALALNKDGTRVAVSEADGVTQVCQIAGQTAAPPEWFNQMVKTFVARRFTKQGVLWTDENEGLGTIQQSLPRDASGPWSHFSRWLLDHPGTRSMTPWSTITLSDYLEAVISRPGEISVQEHRKYAPDVMSMRVGGESP